MLALGACVDEGIVIQDPPGGPPSAAMGFLGYSDSTVKRTVCGNCHIGQQADWQQTAHAGAWADLQASGHAEAYCEGCHTVGPNGNGVADTLVGWAATHDPRYHDVQCESCHGPGLDHITNPDATQPLASIVVGVDSTSGCGECHQGTHNPFVEEWAQSGHGSPNSYPQRQPDCVQCHEARGIFRAWGVKAEYLEKESTALLPISCPVCHDPHDPANSKQLRFPIDEANEDTNLCMKCHHKRGVPDPTTFRGPHSPQGPLLLGTAGWRPPNFQYEPGEIVVTHGTTANPRLCATCHVSRLEVTDSVAGGAVFHATGHLFTAIPCLDADGIPTPTGNCTLQERTFDACTGSGCHGDQQVARAAFSVARQRIDDRVAELQALIAQIPASEFDETDNRYTTGEGARFNAELGALNGSAVHNPFLVEALLLASIAQVKADYNLP